MLALVSLQCEALIDITMRFIRHVRAVICLVAHMIIKNAITVQASEIAFLTRRGGSTVLFVGVITAVIVPITLPDSRDATAVIACKLIVTTSSVITMATLIALVTAIIVMVTFPRFWNAESIRAGEFTTNAGGSRAVVFIICMLTVAQSITQPDHWDTSVVIGPVLTAGIVFRGTLVCVAVVTLVFIRPISAVIIRVTDPTLMDAAFVVTSEKVG